MRSRPAASSSSSLVRTRDIGTSRDLRSLEFLERLNMTAKLKPILQQRQVGDIGRGTLGFDLGNDGCQFIATQRFGDGSFESLHTTRRVHSRHAGGAGDSFQVCTCTGGGGKAADREQTLVV